MDQYPSEQALNTPLPLPRVSPLYGKPMIDRDRFEEWFEDRHLPEIQRQRSSRNVAEFFIKFWKRPEVLPDGAVVSSAPS